MMERRNKPRDIVKVCNAVIRPNIWLQKDPIDDIERHVFTYGEGGCKAIVSGCLLEKDFGVWINMIEMVRQNNDKAWKSDQILVDIGKQMGYKNPWSMIPSLWDSFDRLLDAQIRIRPKNGRGLTAKFCLIEGWCESDGQKGSFGVSQYQEIVESLVFQTTISKKIYFNINGSLARGLYRFLTSQKSFYYDKGYQIRLSSLCKYMNYDIHGRGWWQILPHIKNAMEELKRVGFVGRYTHEKDRLKLDGGMWTFWPVKKSSEVLSKVEVEKAIPEIDFNEVLQLFPKDFQKDKLFKEQLQAWFNYKPNLEIVNWKALMQEWTDGHSIKEVNNRIIHAIACKWKSVFLAEKKELKCEHGHIFGKFSYSRCGCTDGRCSIDEKCKAASFKKKK